MYRLNTSGIGFLRIRIRWQGLSEIEARPNVEARLVSYKTRPGGRHTLGLRRKVDTKNDLNNKPGMARNLLVARV
jgi:hypothetical protein